VAARAWKSMRFEHLVNAGVCIDHLFDHMIFENGTGHSFD
jgi:hypothetical protein